MNLHVRDGLNPQTRAADPARSVFVTANAGSGKTTTLVSRVARLLLGGAAPSAILCVTYTKAAAAEMQARLFETLGKWAVMDDGELSAELAKLDDSDPAALNPARLSEARRLFARALETPGGLKIQTIHAFCEKLLRRFPIEAGVSPRFTVLENEASVALSHAAREDLARAALADAEGPVGEAYSHFAVELDWGRFQDLLALIEAKRAELTDYVARVADGRAPGPYILTGADPQKTPEDIETGFMRWLDRGEVRRVAELMATGSKTDKDRAAELIHALDHDWTFHGLGVVFLTGSGSPRKTMATKQAPPNAAGWLADLQDKFLAARDQLRAAKVADDTIKLLTLANAHAALYEAAKTAHGALDFSDLVARTVELLTVRATAAWVLYKLDGGVDHVLIDEAQDTAPEQWAIMRALTGEFFTVEGTDRTVFAVGDEKQSIYSFQGARPERLRQEAQVYDSLITGAGGAFEGVPLETSYRSTEAVLSFVDVVFATPERARALVGETGEIPHHTAARQGQPGAVELWPLFVDEAPPERDAWTDPVDQEGTASARKRMAQTLALEIRRQVETGAVVFDKSGSARPCGYGDFLILVRRRDATFEEIIRALKAAGAPVAGADRLKLSQHIVFDDLKALARFALFPGDDLTVAEVLRGPFCDVDEDSLFHLAGLKDRKGLWRELKRRASERPEWGQALDLLRAARDARDLDPFGFFSRLLNRVDATGQSGRARILTRLGREAEEAVDETLNQVLAAEGRGGTDLETCLALLEAADVEVKRELEGPRGEVRVMTVHGAKGLEAPVVILPDTTMKAKAQGPSLMPVPLEDGGEAWLMCPGSSKEDCPASADARAAREARVGDESLRLLYVALTRARDRVIVMGRGSKRAPEAGDWWSVIAETFGRLGDQVRELDGGVRRYGADPDSLPAAVAAAQMRAETPDWAHTNPPRDAAARFASPSQMQEQKRIPAPSPLARGEGPGAGLGRFRRGDLIHRLLERLPDLPSPDRPDAARRMLARERDLTDDQRAEMIAAAFGVLDDARFAPVFGPGSRAEVALTGTAPDLPPGVSISGRIDRLVVTPQRVLVVDFKSNRPAPDQAEDADPAYILQMAIYAAVLRRLYPDRAVEAALVWTDGPKLMAVPQGLMNAALENAR
ncbi:double-strand break repair helicase AddA [Brevundimonas diminuta]|uniref:DNA 3'-5' helicase n=1 Tax=Brevundimonas diminuta TaxID=293 RepID=A0A410NU46_BREDI|nr:double-strand break repair helicase AddA [Brevundimonas diminuta]MBD3571768.1 double-strand break repair helicase AddA [Brevundimonas diminuta]QAT13409.1 double-strand break repair helicase AddA [Brevundimonas diminuta]QQB89224.1 double-strand break repair helicase AddA [Brevundimonas diminuta]GEB98991.1 double-strand break repair helicase AddA [Brevundimonas diminuta]